MDSTFRRQPQQERGQRRIDLILDAADELFATVGYEQATTNDIARTAHTSIGSLYQFFPNKDAILRALAERYLGQLREVHERLFGPELVGLSENELVDRVVDALSEFHQAHPGFQPLFFGSRTSSQLAEACQRLQGECVERVRGLLGARAPGADPARILMQATVCVVVTKSLLNTAELGEPARRAALIAETKTVLKRYLRGEAGGPG